MSKRYLILGASSDIGMEYIRTAKWHKDDIIWAQYNRSAEKLKLLQANIECNMVLLQADFLAENSTDDIIRAIEESGEIPTHILHIPSIPIEQKRFKELDWDNFRDYMNVQLRSIVCILQRFIPLMAKKKYGKIVFILSSCTLNVPPKFLSSYVTAKYALLGFMKSIAIEYADKYINVNGISPSMMNTSFLHQVDEKIIEHTARQNPMHRNADIDDVVPCIRYLMSEDSNYVTGMNFPICGGEAF